MLFRQSFLVVFQKKDHLKVENDFVCSCAISTSGCAVRFTNKKQNKCLYPVAFNGFSDLGKA